MTQQTIDILAELPRLPMFQALNGDQLATLAGAVRERHLQKGEILFHKGDRPRGFFFIVGGQMKLAIASSQGNEKVVDILGPKQSFGEAVMFMDRPYPVMAQALLESDLLLIPQAEVFALLEKDALFSRRMLAGLSMRLHALVQDVESYTLRSSAERVIGYLLRHTDPDRDDPVALPASKQVIASLLNLTPETLSRIFHELAEAGLIRVDGKFVHLLDARRLARYQR